MPIKPSAPVTGGLSRWAERRLIRLLRRVKQPWSRLFMEAMAAKMPVLAIEAVVLRHGPNGPEVLLVPRPPDDIHWQGTVTLPGTVLRATDQPGATLFGPVLRRLASFELDVPFFNTASFVGLYHYGKSSGPGGRANTVQAVFLCTLEMMPKVGKWYPVNNLPPNFLAGQQPVLDIALAQFE